MIRQLVERLVGAGSSRDAAVSRVLEADPLDLALHLEQVWQEADARSQDPSPFPSAARMRFIDTGTFADLPPTGEPAWDHFGSSFLLENTRVVQIFSRLVRGYRAGSRLDVLSPRTQRWLDVCDAMLCGTIGCAEGWPGHGNPVDPAARERVRRNAYWRLFGMELAFGTEENGPHHVEPGTTGNVGYVPLFEELLFEARRAGVDVENGTPAAAADDRRIVQLSEELRLLLEPTGWSRRLAREALIAATVLGWLHLTLSSDTPVVVDLGAASDSPSERLERIGHRVGLAPHSKSHALLSMSVDLSTMLCTIEAGQIRDSSFAPIGKEVARLATQWPMATGRPLNVR